MQLSEILTDVIRIADEASERVLHIYESDFKVSYKDDDSPITAADVASHEVIVSGLRAISYDIPILSEEGRDIPWEERQHWRRFWLVDPIDGTKEFTQRSGEFTVNIALIEDGEPTLGVVTAPALKEAFWGVRGEGAWKRDRAGKVRRISVAEPRGSKRVVASKNHLNDETRDFIDKIGDHELVQAGSSLKFCRMAEGRADIYPRLGPTSEWDTAAGHAVLASAGGRVQTLQGEALRYGKEDVLNPSFVAAASWCL
ncbi:3'(2'),5'-bisphosphate nucleotidase CysQ [Marinobacter salinisoli]|uniref:3'(2'),5'-bisphosphate nucleotidase CysQ n=1 Tax=Marinobacter salinisoli TaxID=2769486 RepID=A0ABX7MQE1_9GAMM|nr:3'(2'),5'-bisphosphate nucleotidase CysQ [Marinobacter salinisoli]QSP94494.1 3'(2'),5'-bisphosphate nucleotidase CysQ [Marinobacter salinisoli]